MAFKNTNSFTDATFNAVELIIWTVCEPGIYLIAACIMVYRPLLEKFHIISPSSQGGSRYGGHTGRSGASMQVTSSSSKSRWLGHFAEASAGSIPLRAKVRDANGRFESLEDSGEHPFQQNGVITETTSAKLSWEYVPSGAHPHEARWGA